LKDVRSDIKSLGDDVKRLEIKIEGVAAQLNNKIDIASAQMDTKIEVISAQLNLLANLAKLVIGLVGSLLATGLVAGVWWAGNISSDVRHLQTEVGEIRKALELPKKDAIPPVSVLKVPK
jgi:glucose-6-phosphate dehydrogenase assembly protein OpcA